MCVYVYIHAKRHMCKPQRTTCRSQFCPSTLWIPGIELKWSGLTVSVIYLWSHLTSPQLAFKTISCSIQATVPLPKMNT